MSEDQLDKPAAVALLNEILETELAGVVRYTHYALMIFGHSRIPIVSWLHALKRPPAWAMQTRPASWSHTSVSIHR